MPKKTKDKGVHGEIFYLHVFSTIGGVTRTVEIEALSDTSKHAMIKTKGKCYEIIDQKMVNKMLSLADQITELALQSQQSRVAGMLTT
jgi:hypothetical protein